MWDEIAKSTFLDDVLNCTGTSLYPLSTSNHRWSLLFEDRWTIPHTDSQTHIYGHTPTRISFWVLLLRTQLQAITEQLTYQDISRIQLTLILVNFQLNLLENLAAWQHICCVDCVGSPNFWYTEARYLRIATLDLLHILLTFMIKGGGKK